MHLHPPTRALPPFRDSLFFSFTTTPRPTSSPARYSLNSLDVGHVLKVGLNWCFGNLFRFWYLEFFCKLSHSGICFAFLRIWTTLKTEGLDNIIPHYLRSHRLKNPTHVVWFAEITNQILIYLFIFTVWSTLSR